MPTQHSISILILLSFPIICPLELKAVTQVEERGCDVPVVAEAKVIRFFLSIS